jgi:hypothetical protein
LLFGFFTKSYKDLSILIRLFLLSAGVFFTAKHHFLMFVFCTSIVSALRLSTVPFGRSTCRRSFKQNSQNRVAWVRPIGNPKVANKECSATLQRRGCEAFCSMTIKSCNLVFEPNCIPYSGIPKEEVLASTFNFAT